MRSLKDKLLFRISEWALLIVIAVAIGLIVALLTERNDDGKTAVAQIFETKIVVRGEGSAKWHYFDYNLPKAGSATLRLSNGARTNAPSVDRVEGAKVTLRGKSVVTPKDFNQQVDVLEVPVELQEGTNRLGVLLHAEAGKRVSLRIDASPDKIVLAHVLNPVVVGRESLRARATVTALGWPVRRARVQFELLKLGQKIEQKATTNKAGIATAFLSGFDAGEGELQAKLIGTDLTDAVPITGLAKRTLNIRQRYDSVRLEVGSDRTLGLTINLLEIVGDQEIVKVKHIVLPAPGSDPEGVLVRNNFPSQGQVVTVAKKISMSTTFTAVNPGRYTVTTTAAVLDKDGANARESFSIELAVEVVPEGAPDPLRLSKPLISPMGIAPGAKQIVVFRTLIAGVSKPPQVLYLDRVSNRGEFIAQETELRDDGKEHDAIAGDGFYSGQRELGSEKETEIYFRFRTEYFGKTLTSGIAVLPITRLPLGSRPSKGPTVVDPKGQSKIFTNELIVGALTGVSPKHVRTIVEEVSDRLELKSPDDLEIVGYIPSLDSYLVEFKVAPPPKTLQLVKRAVSAFSAYAEIKYASPSIMGRPAGVWLSNIGADQLRSHLEGSGLPVSGASDIDIGVAIIDDGVNCDDPDLDGKCPDWTLLGLSASDPCEAIYKKADASTTHGTKVAALVASREGPADIQGVNEGVARDVDVGAPPPFSFVKLLPFDFEEADLPDDSDTQQHGAAFAMNCAVTAGAHILNVSWEWEIDPIDPAHPEGVLYDAVCNAVCSDRLVVAAAGNGACQNYSSRYPAAYNGDSVTGDDAIADCSCPDGSIRPTNGWMLKVGGTDMADAEGIQCNSAHGIYRQSQRGEIYAPGWGVAKDNIDLGLPYNDPPCDSWLCYGTSWSAPLVAGCAAILGAVQKWIDANWWNPNAIESRLRNNATTFVTISDGSSYPLLNCLTAVAEPKDLVFVLDRSGSMSWPTNINTTLADNRWEALKMAVGEFTELIPDFAQPGSQFGLTLFSSRVLPALPTTDPEYDPRFNLTDSDFSALVDINSGLADKVTAELNSQDGHVYGSTAMGAGLQDGIAKMDATQPGVVVLFTDGEQNVNPLVDILGCTYLNHTPEYPATDVNSPCPVDPESEFVKITAVGIGSPSGDYHTRLQNLASKNGGKFLVTDNGTDFSDECTNTILDIWDCAVATVFYGASPQMVTSYKGTLSDTLPVPTFDLNKYVSQLLIKLSFSRKFKRSELSKILEDVRIMKDGTDVMNYFQPVFPSNSTNSVLLKTNFLYRSEDETSSITPEGRYSVQITAPSATPPNLAYKVVSYADDHGLDMDWRVSPAAPRVNQPFSPTIRLIWRGNPVTNAIVEARILKPGDDMNDLLAKHPQKVDPSSAPDMGSPGYQKYLHLIENDSNFLAQLRPKEQRLMLTHQGDGQYSASYDPGDVSGIYQIVYRVSAENEEFGKIQRKAVQSVYTRFGDIDLNRSAVTSIIKGKTVTINFRPITKYGRFIGPAQGSAFSIDGAGIRLSSITDHQDGGYTLVLEGNRDAQVSLKLLGEKIYQGPASKIGTGLGLLGWLIWLIIVVILLLLIWLVWRVI